jgi:hypothetical protein
MKGSTALGKKHPQGVVGQPRASVARDLNFFKSEQFASGFTPWTVIKLDDGSGYAVTDANGNARLEARELLDRAPAHTIGIRPLSTSGEVAKQMVFVFVRGT